MSNAFILPDGENVKVTFQEAGKDPFNLFDPMRLLAEWYNWWSTTDTAPCKMPNSLHIRTAMVLSKRDMEE